MILLLIILFLVFGGFGGWYGGNRGYPDNGWAGPGFGFGTILLIVLIVWLLSSYGGVHIFR
jgi:hypothetical protein